MKTNTKKSPAKKASAEKKSPVVKKVPAKKIVPKAKTEKITVKKSVPVAASTSTPKKVIKKSSPKKSVPAKTVSVPKIEAKVSTSSAPTVSAKEGVKILGILHLVGNLFSGGVLGILLVIIYYFFQHEKLSKLEKDTCFEIINFNLSFLVYSFIAGLLFGLGLFLIFVLVGFLLLPVLPLVIITWFVLMIMGFLKHLKGENYKYPFIIRFVS